MFSRIHNKLGTSGLIVACVALVFAMVGGAYAAKGAFTPKEMKEIQKIAKKYAGKQGPQGEPGPAGTNGTNGKDGAPGAPGQDGADGKSVLATEFGPTEEPASEPCAVEPGVGRGGSQFEGEGSGTQTYACNGAEGSPWTVGGVLPPEATETGGWTAFSTADVAASVPISFPIRLTAEILGTNTHIVSIAQQTGHTVPAECTVEGVEGSAANPLAAPGHLCVFVGQNGEQGEPTGISKLVGGSGASRTGAVLSFSKGLGSAISGRGSFAVTAP